jgi:hypothetical protein
MPQPMSTAVHRSPNKLWRSNSIPVFNLRMQPLVKILNCCRQTLEKAFELLPEEEEEEGGEVDGGGGGGEEGGPIVASATDPG